MRHIACEPQTSIINATTTLIAEDTAYQQRYYQTVGSLLRSVLDSSWVVLRWYTTARCYKSLPISNSSRNSYGKPTETQQHHILQLHSHHLSSTTMMNDDNYMVMINWIPTPIPTQLTRSVSFRFSTSLLYPPTVTQPSLLLHETPLTIIKILNQTIELLVRQ
jgi:hypothetical protein